jgi:predicted RNA-binding Zn-ribbon protein involved in translation (DUF1610 family)
MLMEESKIKAEAALSGNNASSPTPSPTEPFPCPNCGQMLAATCKVCVICHEPVDLSKVQRAAPPWTPPLRPQAEVPSKGAKSHFSWPIFFAVVAGYLAIAVITRIYLNPMHYELLLSTLLVISSVWVSYDAHSKHLPHPLRWGVSALLLWIVVFPWYLSRRRNPQSPCPLMEAEGSVFIRALLWVLLIFFVLSLIAAVVVRKPPH